MKSTQRFSGDSLSHDIDVVRTDLCHPSETATASGRKHSGLWFMWYTHQSNCECACVCVALAFALIIAGLTHTLDRWPSSAPPSQTLTCFLSLSLTNTQTHTTNTNTPYNSAQRSGDLSSQAVSSSLHTAWGLNTHNHTHTHHTHGLKAVSADDDSDVRKALYSVSTQPVSHLCLFCPWMAFPLFIFRHHRGSSVSI